MIIVDDYSFDDTEEVVKKWKNYNHPFKVNYIRLTRNSGPAIARNTGLKNAKGGIVAFTDTDCVVHKYWLYNLVKKINMKNKIVGAGGKVLPLTPNHLISRFNSFHRILEPPDSLLYLVTANCCYVRKIALNVGGFDEDIKKPGGEDISLSIKLWKNGWRFEYEPDSIIYHDYRNSFKNFYKTFFNYGYGCGYVTKKYLRSNL